MAYADQKPSGNRIVALIVVAVLHILLGYGLVTGLAFEAVKQVAKRVTTIDIEEEKQEETPPPPPPEQKQVAPPPVAPPPTINVNPEPPPIATVPVAPPAPVLAPPAPPAPPVCKPRAPTPRGNPGDWANSNDYPSRALREDREGVTRFSVSVGEDGKVQSCTVTGSSGHSDLDSTTCQLIQRRARFKVDTSCGAGSGGGTWNSSVRWQIPK